MLAIRLQRIGRKKQATYRVVISEKTKDMYGNHLEILGNFNPHTKETTLKNDRIEHWLSKGAQPSDTVHNLLINQGIIKDAKKAKAVSISKKRASRGKNDKPAEDPEQSREKETKEEPKAAEKTETPKEEVKEEKPAEKTKSEEPKKDKA